MIAQIATRAQRKSIERTGRSYRKAMMIDSREEIAQSRERCKERMFGIEYEGADIEDETSRNHASLQAAEARPALEQLDFADAIARKLTRSNDPRHTTSKHRNPSRHRLGNLSDWFLSIVEVTRGVREMLVRTTGRAGRRDGRDGETGR
jgi:hypothetical protein